MTQNTLKATLTERLWEQAQGRESAYIVAQEAARVFGLKAHAVSTRYAFAPCHDLFRFTAAGVCIQAAMTLTDTDGESLTVVANLDDDGEQVWFLTDVSALRFDAQIYIAAVQSRIEANGRAN